MRKSVLLLTILGWASVTLAAGNAKHVVVVVWDGMRPDFISAEHTPMLARLAREGVMFENHHAVYCSATEVNGAALATGDYPQNSGILANNDFRPRLNPVKPVGMQSRAVVEKGDAMSGGHHVQRPTVAEILQAAGKRTVIAGAKEVALLLDRRPRGNFANVNLFAGKSLPPDFAKQFSLTAGKFPDEASTNSDDVLINAPRDEWTRRALLESLWSNGVPEFSLLWLSEPDFSQHAAGPGSAKALAALESSDRQLAAVLTDLERRGLRNKTDVFVVSDHGFSTIQKAVDVCEELKNAGFRSQREFEVLPENGDVLVIGQGGSVLFYVVGHEKIVTARLVEFLQRQEYSGVIFTREKFSGTFALAEGKIDAANPPDVILSMRWSAEKSGNGTPGVFWSDGNRKPGSGNHASLSRFDLHNTLVACGPDLKKNFSDTLPTGNVDIAPTILWLLGVKQKTPMDGRVLGEAMSVAAPGIKLRSARKLEAYNGDWHQYLQASRVNDTVYLDEGNGGVE